MHCEIIVTNVSKNHSVPAFHNETQNPRKGFVMTRYNSSSVLNVQARTQLSSSPINTEGDEVSLKLVIESVREYQKIAGKNAELIALIKNLKLVIRLYADFHKQMVEDVSILDEWDVFEGVWGVPEGSDVVLPAIGAKIDDLTSELENIESPHENFNIAKFLEEDFYE